MRSAFAISACVLPGSFFIPLHHQVLNWAMSEKLDMPIIADNVPRFHFAKMK